jgi:hypothetical protein
VAALTEAISLQKKRKKKKERNCGLPGPYTSEFRAPAIHLEQWLAGLGVSARPFLVVGWLSVIAAGHRGSHRHSMFITYKNKIYWLGEAENKHGSMGVGKLF